MPPTANDRLDLIMDEVRQERALPGLTMGRVAARKRTFVRRTGRLSPVLDFKVWHAAKLRGVCSNER